MKQKIAAGCGIGAVIFFATSGLFEWFTKIFVWLITIDSKTPTISVVGQIFVKYSTWIITFRLIKKLFKAIGWYDSDAMKMVYFAISTLVSFALSYVIMIFEKYILWIALGILIIILLVIGIGLTLYFVNKKRTKKSEILNEN